MRRSYKGGGIRLKRCVSYVWTPIPKGKLTAGTHALWSGTKRVNPVVFVKLMKFRIQHCQSNRETRLFTVSFKMSQNFKVLTAEKTRNPLNTTHVIYLRPYLFYWSDGPIKSCLLFSEVSVIRATAYFNQNRFSGYRILFL